MGNFDLVIQVITNMVTYNFNYLIKAIEYNTRGEAINFAIKYWESSIDVKKKDILRTQNYMEMPVILEIKIIEIMPHY